MRGVLQASMSPNGNYYGEKRSFCDPRKYFTGKGIKLFGSQNITNDNLCKLASEALEQSNTLRHIEIMQIMYASHL